MIMAGTNNNRLVNRIDERGSYGEDNDMSDELEFSKFKITRGPKLKAEENAYMQKDCVSPASSITRGNKFLLEPVKTHFPEERGDSPANETNILNLTQKKFDLNPLRILMLSRKVGKFVFNLRKNVSRMDFSYLNKYQQGVINDWSCYSELKSENAKMKKISFLKGKG